MNEINKNQEMINKHLENVASTDFDSKEFENSITAVRSIRGEHSEESPLDRLAEFDHEEIELAFNPSKITEEEFENLSYEEKLKNYIILTTYYEIPRPKKVSILDLNEKFHTYTSAYRIDRIDNKDNFEILENYSDEEDAPDYTELEKLIGIKKNEFLHLNSEATQKMIGFDYEKFMDECHRRAKTEEQRDKCNNFFFTLYNQVLTFIVRDFQDLDTNLKNYYHRSYQKALPIEYLVSVTGEVDLFDEALFELNPVEFQKILHALEDIRRMDKTRSQFPNWYAYYQMRLRESKVLK